MRLAAEGVTLADGQRGEICLALEAWVQAATPSLARGVALLIDYGYPPSSCTTRSAGATGRCAPMSATRSTTTHTRTSAGRTSRRTWMSTRSCAPPTDAGLTHLGTTTQAEFLVGLGMDEHLRAIQADPATTMEAYLAVRSSVMRLLDPAATGRFRVMAFGRAWPDGARRRRPGRSPASATARRGADGRTAPPD